MAKSKGELRLQLGDDTRGPMIPVGKKQRLIIEHLVHDGRGIAREAGTAWFVSDGLLGEELEVRMLGARSKVADARSERLFSSSDLRHREPCTVAGRCGSCTPQYLEHGEQLTLKQRTLQEQLQRFAGIKPEEWAALLIGPESGHQRRARIAARWDARTRHLDVGFRVAASQEIVTFNGCLVPAPPL